MISMLADRAKNEGRGLDAAGLAYINAGVPGWSEEDASAFIEMTGILVSAKGALATFEVSHQQDPYTADSGVDIILKKAVYGNIITEGDRAYLAALDITWVDEYIKLLSDLNTADSKAYLKLRIKAGREI
jgi:hypothetical protein